MPKTLLLIDGDEMVFKAASAIEQEVDWGDGNWVLWSNPENTYENFQGVIKRLCDRFKVHTSEAVIAFSGTYGDTPNFRLAIADTYKSHRAKDRKPMCYWLVRERCESQYLTKSMPGLEADDVMGILATKPSTKHRIICSADKDMKTLPTTVWNGKDLVTYTEAEANYWHMYQTLIGDTADGYKGCPKIGPVKAEKLLRDPEAPGWTEEKGEHMETEGKPWPRVLHAYGKAMGEGRDMEAAAAEALTQARLARILRHSDWDGVKKQPILWSPNG